MVRHGDLERICEHSIVPRVGDWLDQKIAMAMVNERRHYESNIADLIKKEEDRASAMVASLRQDTDKAVKDLATKVDKDIQAEAARQTKMARDRDNQLQESIREVDTRHSKHILHLEGQLDKLLAEASDTKTEMGKQSAAVASVRQQVAAEVASRPNAAAMAATGWDREEDAGALVFRPKLATSKQEIEKLVRELRHNAAIPESMVHELSGDEGGRRYVCSFKGSQTEGALRVQKIIGTLRPPRDSETTAWKKIYVTSLSGDQTEVNVGKDQCPRTVAMEMAGKRAQTAIMEIYPDLVARKFSRRTNAVTRNLDVRYEGKGVLEITPRFEDVPLVRWVKGLAEQGWDRARMEPEVVEAVSRGRFRDCEYED